MFDRVTAVLTQSRTEYFGLRSMDPMRDLGGVADLIEHAFAAELDQSGQNALRELRLLSRMKPALWWMAQFNPDHSDFLSGFVWEEDGKIVGNITVNRASAGSRRWLISNVAVSEDYRGRGIGRSLMDAALELVNEYRGTSASLQVRGNNQRAKRLYHLLGFQEISGTAYLRMGRVPRIDGIYALPPLPQGLILRPRKYDTKDTLEAYHLATSSTPPSTQKEWPLYRRNFQLGSQQRLNNILGRMVGIGPSDHWVVEDGRRFVALLDAHPGAFKQSHQIRLIVHPDWRGQLETLLVGQALDYLHAWRNRSIAIRHPSEHSEAITGFKNFGFREDQTLLWMKREM